MGIYGPIYFYLWWLIEFWIPSENQFFLGRAISYFSVLSIAFISSAFIFSEIKKYSSKSLTIITAVFFGLVIITPNHMDFIISDLVQITAHGLMYFLGVLGLFCFFFWSKNNNYLFLILSILFTSLSVFTKQQGAIFPLCLLIYFIFNERNLKRWIIAGLSYLLICGLVIIYFEANNDWNFLHNLFIGLSDIIPNSSRLARVRLWDFLSTNYPIVLTSLFLMILYRKQNIKSLSFCFILAAFLICLKTAGNAGGGPNYFYGLWMAICIYTAPRLLAFFIEKNEHIKFKSKSVNTSFIQVSMMILISLHVYNYIQTPGQRTVMLRDNQEIREEIMRKYYKDVGDLLNEIRPENILVHRGAGAFVSQSQLLWHEMCTINSYGFVYGDSFSQKEFIKQISQQEFDLIVSGLQPFHPDIKSVITENYKTLDKTSFYYHLKLPVEIKFFVPK